MIPLKPPWREIAGLTAAQSKALTFLRNYLVEHGEPPEHWEIANHLGHRQENAVRSVLWSLAEKGLIELTIPAQRGIRLVVGSHNA